MKTNLLGGLLIASTLGMTPMMASADSGTLMSDGQLDQVVAGYKNVDVASNAGRGGGTDRTLYTSSEEPNKVAVNRTVPRAGDICVSIGSHNFYCTF